MNASNKLLDTSTIVRSLFTNIENMIPASFLKDDCELFKNCYKLKTKVSENRHGNFVKQTYTCLDVKSGGAVKKRLIKITPKQCIFPNYERKVKIASEAYLNFVANDIDGVHQLVDYLESEKFVFFVYKREEGKTTNLYKFIRDKYGSPEYDIVVLSIFETVAMTVLELFNHGIIYNSSLSKNVLINLKTHNSSLTNFENATKLINQSQWEEVTKNLGILLFELSIGKTPEECPEFTDVLSKKSLPAIIKNLIHKSFSHTLTKIDLHNFLEQIHK